MPAAVGAGSPHEPAGTSLMAGPGSAPGRVLLTLAHGLARQLADRVPPAGEPVTGPELGAWLRAQREARGWASREMARRLIEAAHEAGDTSVPGVGGMYHNLCRWENQGGVSGRYQLCYCRVLGISPRQFGTVPPAGLAALPAALTALTGRWLGTPAPTPGTGTAGDNGEPPAPVPAPASVRADALEVLRAAWGDVYDITITAARYRARRRDGTGPPLAGDTTAQLNMAIRADWTASAGQLTARP